jgi:hypothetical protein
MIKMTGVTLVSRRNYQCILKVEIRGVTGAVKRKMVGLPETK